MQIALALLGGLAIGALLAYVLVKSRADATLQSRLDAELERLRDATIEKTRARVERELREDLRDRVRDELERDFTPEIKADVLARAEAEAQRLIDEGQSSRDATIREAELEARTITLNAQKEIDGELKERRGALDKIEERLSKREHALDTRADKLDARERDLNERERSLDRTERKVTERDEAVSARESSVDGELERIAALSRDAAREEIIKRVEDDARQEGARRARKIEEAIVEEADRKAKKLLSVAVQRYAGEFAVERAVSVVSLPADDMKGRIIGREGRNIRALEAATGIDIIIDDTPEAVIVSGFDPVRREIARLSLEKLIADGRIHPARIEEVVKKTEQEISKIIREAGEQAAFELGIHGLHPELLKLIGRLRYRTSYGQNMWGHSIEVGFLCGLMAAELGVNVKEARRAGLLHDIGKALTHEQEGSHALIGAELCKKYGETELIRNAVAAHHDEEPQQSVIAHLVIAADALSGARPGARREILETYIKRLQDLERISMEFNGVEKTYAIQAGREIRVVVSNSEVNDDQAYALSRDIARRIEEELTYPGQIKVCVIREMRAVEYAR